MLGSSDWKLVSGPETHPEKCFRMGLTGVGLSGSADLRAQALNGTAQLR